MLLWGENALKQNIVRSSMAWYVYVHLYNPSTQIFTCYRFADLHFPVILYGHFASIT